MAYPLFLGHQGGTKSAATLMTSTPTLPALPNPSLPEDFPICHNQTTFPCIPFSTLSQPKLQLQYPDLPKPKCILRDSFHILSSNPTTHSFLKTPPNVNFYRPPNFRQIHNNTHLCSHPLGDQSHATKLAENTPHLRSHQIIH